MTASTRSRGPVPIPMYGNLSANKRPVHRTLLHFWLSTQGVSRAKFSRQMGCNPKMVDYWADGRCIPSIPYAFMIEKLTHGAVGAATWLGTEVGRHLWEQIQRKAEPDATQGKT